MADLQRTTIWREVNKIISDGVKQVNHRWECYIHANGKMLKALYVNGVSQSCRYTERFTDRLSIVASIGEGVYQHDIVPYMKNLEVTIVKKPLAESIVANEINSTIETFRYRAFLMDPSSQLLESGIPKAESKDTLDRIKIRTFEVQLISKNVEHLRLKYIGGIYRDVTGINLVRQLLTIHSQEVADDSRAMITGVTIGPNPSEVKKRQIIIPDGTPLISGKNSAMHIINRMAGGIFMHGFKYYHSGNQWYVFAPFDTTPFESAQKSLTVINVPNNRLTNIERTFRETSSQLIVLATSGVKSMDVSNEAQLNQGNGARFIDSKQVLNGIADVDLESDTAKINGKAAINEFILNEREDGLNNVNVAGSKLTSGYYIEYAELTRRNGGMIQFVWENAKPGIIYPGMPAKYIYLVGDIPFEIFGSVVAVDYVDNPTTKTPTEQRFSTSAAVTLFVASKIPKELKNQ